MLSSKIALWFVRKAVYVAGGTALAFVASHVFPSGSGPTDYNLTAVTLNGAVGGLGAAVLGDLRRSLLPDVLQAVTGEDPRKDG